MDRIASSERSSSTAKLGFAVAAVVLPMLVMMAVLMDGRVLSSLLSDRAVARLAVARRDSIVRDDATMRSLAEARYWYVQDSVERQRVKLLASYAPLIAAAPAIPAGGKRHVILFFDYDCAPCREFDARLRTIAGRKGVDVRYLFIAPRGSADELAAVAAILSQKAGRFPDLHRYLTTPGPINEAKVRAAAQAVGLPAPALDAGLEDPELANRLEEGRDLAERLGVTGTPATIIGGALVSGSISSSEIEQKLAARDAWTASQE